MHRLCISRYFFLVFRYLNIRRLLYCEIVGWCELLKHFNRSADLLRRCLRLHVNQNLGTRKFNQPLSGIFIRK